MSLAAIGGTLGVVGGTMPGLDGGGDPAPVIVGVPQSFTLVETSPPSTNLGIPQGVAVDDDGTTRWGAGGPAAGGAASDGRSILKFDEAWSLIDEANLADSIVGFSQTNGVSYDRLGNRVFVGANNYPTDPKQGRVIEVDATTLDVIATHDVGANHNEGGAIRPGTDEFWACYHDTPTFRRYDASTSTWTLQASYQAGFVSASVDYYQSLVWWNDTIFLAPLHGSQTSPPRIDVFEYDPDLDTVTPLYRLTRPTVTATQGFGFVRDRSEAYFSERDGGGAGIHRAARCSVAAIDLLDRTPNAAHAQLTGATHWYPGLRYDGTAVNLLDEVGAADGTPTSGAYVFPVLDADGLRWDRYLGGVNSRISLGVLLASALTSYTVSFWYEHGSTSAQFLAEATSGVAAAGDWKFDFTSGSNRPRFVATAIGATTLRTVLAPADRALTVGQKVLLTATGDGSGTKLYMDGTLALSTASTSQIGGNGQTVYLGATSAGTAAQPHKKRDLRFYDRALSAVEVAALHAEATRLAAFA